MAKLDLYKQSLETLVHVEKFLEMCKHYGIDKMREQLEFWSQAIEEDNTPVPDDSFLGDVNEYLFANEMPENLADVSTRLKEVKILIKTQRLRSDIRLIKVLDRFAIVFKAPFRREWDDKWKSILVDDDNVEICKFDLPHQQKANPEYDIGTFLASLLNSRVKGHTYVGLDIPNVIDPYHSSNHLDVYYSLR